MHQTSTLTIRIIKSFEYRTVKSVVLHNVDLSSITPKQLFEKVMLGLSLPYIVYLSLIFFLQEIQNNSAFKPFRNKQYDSLKIYTKAHGMKSQNLVINLETDDDFLDIADDTKCLKDFGIEHEHEFSVFVKSEYEQYKQDPSIKW